MGKMHSRNLGKEELIQSGMVLSLRIPTEPFGFLKGGGGSGAGLFQQHDFEIPQSEPCRIDQFMVMAAHEARQHVAERGL